MKQQPKSYEAEESLLGAILLKGKSIYEKVSPWIRVNDAFYNPDNKKIWKVVTALYKENCPIDIVTVMEKSKALYKNGDAFSGYYLTGLPEKVPTTANVEEYARIIWEKYIQRETAKSANRLYNLSFDEGEDIQNILDEHTRLVDELKEIQPSRAKTIEDIVEEAKINIKEGGNIIPFGMEVLDYPAGGMTRKEITVLGGRPGHGKTTLMINVLKSLIEQGLKVMLFNREMSNTEMIKKMCVLEDSQLLYANVRRNDFTDGSDAKTGSMSIRDNKSGTYALTIGISGCDKKFGHIRGLFSDNRGGQVYAIVVDKHYLQNEKEKLSFSLDKFGDYFIFTLEEMIERSSEWFDAEFEKRQTEIGRPDVATRERKKNSNTPKVNLDSIMDEVKSKTLEIIVKGLSDTSSLSESDIRTLLKKVA